MEDAFVGNPVNFRGLIYSPVNEQGVVYLFGLISEDLNIRVESIQQGYPDCTAILYRGKGKWKRITIEFEYQSSNFITHNHDPKGIDMIVCWVDDLTDEQKKKGGIDQVDIKELKSLIDTPEVPNKKLKEPEVSTSENTKFDLQYHLERGNVNKDTQELFKKLRKSIMDIDPDIWDKYCKTTITYYSPEKTFVYLNFRQSRIRLTIFTNEKKIDGVNNVKNHPNWGIITIKSESELNKVMGAIKESHEIMKGAINDNINTGWFAKTTKENFDDDDQTNPDINDETEEANDTLHSSELV